MVHAAILTFNPHRGAAPPAPRPPQGPRATLLNQVVTASGVEITLLSYVVVDHSLRLYGALRVMDHHDPLVATTPVLELTRGEGVDPYHPLGAHVLPLPPTVWLAWMFELADAATESLAARIEQLELGFRVGRKTEIVTGPWAFTGLPAPSFTDHPAPRPTPVVP